jgi:diaminopimelate decarboxylase
MLEDVALAELAQRHGTPLFVYSKAAMLGALAAYQRGLAGREALICYAMKANSTLAVLKVFADAGCGFDIVSGGELERVLAAGGAAGKIVFSGIGKTRAEIRRALEAGIRCFNVEPGRAGRLDEVARACGRRAPVSIRVNPNVDARTHPYISTGLKGNKFGIAHEQALAAYRTPPACRGCRWRASTATSARRSPRSRPTWRRSTACWTWWTPSSPTASASTTSTWAAAWHRRGRHAPAADTLWAALLARWTRGLWRPGADDRARPLAGGQCRPVPDRGAVPQAQRAQNFCIVDAAMNDLPRPALYEAFHRIVPLRQAAPGAAATVRRGGPGVRKRRLAGPRPALAVQPGEHLAVLSAGAYCMSMASNYNTRPRAARCWSMARRRAWCAGARRCRICGGAKPFDVRLGPDFKPNQPLARLINPIKLSIS